MKRDWLRIVVVLGIVAAALSVTVWAPRSEPIYQGRTLSYWVEQFWSGTKDYKECQTAFRSMGTKAIPFLMAQARRQDSFRERAYRMIWPSLPAPLQRRIPQPHPVSYELHRKLGAVLGEIGQPALPAVLSALQERSEGARLVAVEAVKILAPKTDSAVKLVARLLTDPNSLTRIEAVFALGAMMPSSRLALPELIGALHASDVGPPFSGKGSTVFVRAHAARVLGELGSTASPALPELRRLLRTGDSYTRQQAAVALWRIARDTNSIMLLIAEMKRAIQPGSAIRAPLPQTTCELCLKAFAEIGPAAKAAAPVIKETMEAMPQMRLNLIPVQKMMNYARDALDKIEPEALNDPSTRPIEAESL